MIKDFCKKKKKMVSLVFFDILQLPHGVISNSEKLTHPKGQSILSYQKSAYWLEKDHTWYQNI